jgi:uncharacterized protein (DUF1697 family)
VKKFIVLFKGVNVGGNNLLPMKALVTLLEQHNYQAVSSYIQSGNIVLKCVSKPTQDLKAIIAKNYGFSPEIFILNEAELSVITEHNPYSQYEGKFVHFYFCQNPVQLNFEKLNKFIEQSEEYHVKGNVFYLHAPNGIGRSKLISNIESCLGQIATGRNLNTVKKISAMVQKTY